ncbi:TonB-dependent receptor [Phenylobacterium sp.]|uniref:TonB-dependent receptor n=1 Tax=Phenylobacterium sp. TaxID=1871053 RepID=UPI003D277AE6
MQQIKNITRTSLMTGVALVAVLSAGAAFAADDAAAPSVEEVVVTGRPIAESQAAALQIQKESPSLVSVIAADAVGRLPDQNIAFAIGRLPGVAVERDQGQARYVNLRGAKINWTTVSFDGLTIVSPEGRQSRFDNIPSALASQIIVTKAVTPDMPGETIAGNVDIRTRSAFDRSGLFVAGKAALGYVELGGGEESDVSLVVSDRFLDDRLGVLALGSFYHRNMVTDNWETDPYQTAGNGRDARPGNEDRRWAREFENKAYRLTRENVGGVFKVEYEFDENNKVEFSSIYTAYIDEELRSNYIFRMDNGATTTAATACPAVVAPQTTSGFADICNGNTPQKGTVYGTQITANFNSLETKEYTWTNTVGGKHRWNDWDVTWKLNYTQAEDGQDAPARTNFASPTATTDRPTVDYDFTDRDNNTVRLFRTVVTGTGATAVRSKGAAVQSIDGFLLPPVTGTAAAISTTDGGDPTFAYTAKFDAEREFEMFDAPFKLKFGGLYGARTKKHEEKVYAATLAQITAAGQTFNFDQIRNLKPYQAELKLGYDFNYFSKDAVDKRASDLLKAGVLVRQNTNANYFRVQEEIFAGYAMGTWTQDWGNIVAGARIERIKNTGSAFGGVGATTVLVSASNDSVLVFPSAHINWDLNDEMKVRVGFTSGAARPDFDELRPNLVANDSTQTISGGNPDAKPERAYGVDAYYEWYMASGGYLSAGVYYKDIKDALFSQSGVFGRDILNFGGVDRSGYTLSTLRNGGTGHILGAEAAIAQSIEPFLEDSSAPDWVKGFGIQANLTLNDSEFNVPSVGGVPKRKIPVIGASDVAYNISLYYERYGLSARLAYQFRTEWGQSVGDYQVLNGKTVPVTNGDIYWNDDEELDLSIRYRINDNFELTFDAANLTNDPGRRYGDSAAYPIEWERFGRRFIAGVNFTF